VYILDTSSKKLAAALDKEGTSGPSRMARDKSFILRVFLVENRCFSNSWEVGRRVLRK
jgi:hypothetical protein